MKSQNWVLTALVLLVVITSVGIFMTRDSAPSARTSTVSRTAPQVDDTPLKTARQLAPLAATPEELQLAQEAARLADHEVDLAFADALREAAEHPPQIDPALHQRIQRLETVVSDEQSHLAQLQRRLSSAKPTDTPGIQQEIDLLGAQKALDEDELEDARQDMIRAGGDAEGTLQRVREAHEAAQHDSGTPKAAAASAPVNIESRNLAGQIRAALWLRDKHEELDSARRDAERVGSVFVGEHESLERHVDTEKTQNADARKAAVRLSDGADNGTSSRDATATLNSLKHFADDQKALADLDQRVLDERELAGVYGRWIDSVTIQERSVQHSMLQSILWMLLIALGVYTGSQLSDHYLARAALQRKGLSRLRAAVRFALQAGGVLLAVCIVLGVPSNPATVLGLAGAGLTIALKDFIVGFFGWFVLMGRNGIHVGDWVEINGVVGEVIEVGLLRTVLMETGNWTDSGHPTGRKVAFVNSFAIEGHYFNFSTTGQWLWDELQLLIPPGRNPHELVDAIQTIVEAESSGQAARAEEEWQRSAGHVRLQSLSVAPAIQLRPTITGVEMRVRYITSANERYATRARMYERIVDVLQAETVR
jgi:small-conductance mechanosensitive channel